MTTRDLFERLNPEQRRAASHRLGPALVLAGPGTGKTTTLVARYGHLLSEGVHPSEIVATTFTKKAASELKDRIRNETGLQDERAPISTMHSLCHRLLGRPPVVEQFEQFAILRRVAKGWRGDFADLLDAIQRFKDTLVTPADALPTAERAGRAVRDEAIRTAEAYDQYQLALEAEGLHDYGDLIGMAVRALQDPAKSVPEVDGYRFLMVDEYQDINPAQDALIKELSGHHGNLWVIGDDDQAIYGWRGSDVKYITEFEHNHAKSRVYRLSANYRSNPPILRAADLLISNNKKRLPKPLKATKEGTAPVCLCQLNDEHHEAMWVVDAIKKLFRAGVHGSGIAILLRTNFLTVEFEAALRNSGIPYVVRGGSGFWDLPAVQAVLAALWRADPNRRNTSCPWRGPQFLIPILDEEIAKVSSRKFPARVNSLTGLVEKHVPKTASQERQMQWTGGATQLRLEAKDWAEPGVFLDHCTKAKATTKEDDGDAVVLSTIHQAKGLEWDAVFLSACEGHLMPHEKASDLEEERRLAFVAATRAKRFLAATWSVTRGNKAVRGSPFTDEMTRGLPSSEVDRRVLSTKPGLRIGKLKGVGEPDRKTTPRKPPQSRAEKKTPRPKKPTAASSRRRSGTTLELSDLVQILTANGHEVSVERSPHLGYMVVVDGQSVVSSSLKIHLRNKLSDFMKTAGLI